MRRFLPSTVFEWIVVVAVIVVGWMFWNGRKDSNDSAKTAVLKERVRVDTLIDRRDSAALEETRRQLNMALANGVKVVEHWNNSAPKPLATGTAHDSVTQLAAQVKSCRDSGDVLVQSVVVIQSKCQAFRDSATTSLRDKDKRYNDLDSLYKLARVEKRLQPYGDLLYEPLKQRPVIGLGLTSKMFWKLDAKAEAQYAIPRSRPDSTDGLRVLVGAHIRF